MALPSIIDIAHKHLMTDRNKMKAAGLPDVTIRHLERLRDMYNYWLAFPSKKDRDIVYELRTRYGIGDTVAREDLRLIKTLLGDLQSVSKKYMRLRVTQMCERAYEKAEAANNPRDMVAAARELAKAYQLDKEDERANILDQLQPMKFVFTDDPTVIGIPRMPDHRQKIQKLKEKYYSEATEYVQFEDIDAGIDDLFNPKIHGNGNTGAANLSE